jgi:uncharacterized protein YjbI with pentapeptide repeats
MITIYCDTGDKIAIESDSLVGICLDDRNLHRANLDGKDFTGSSFRRADLRAASLEETVLSHCHFDDSRLFGVWAKKAFLRGARCRGAKMNCANLSCADLRDSDLSLVELSQANLRGATLLGATVDGIILTDAEYDSSTIWPINFDPISRGAKLR